MPVVQGGGLAGVKLLWSLGLPVYACKCAICNYLQRSILGLSNDLLFRMSRIPSNQRMIKDDEPLLWRSVKRVMVWV